MTTTVAQIAAKAFTSAKTALSDAIHACTVTKATNGAYNAATGAYSRSEASYAGRAVIDVSTPIADTFPDYTVGPGDVLMYVEGLSVAPAENDKITINSVTRTIRAVGDIAGAGTFFAIVAR